MKNPFANDAFRAALYGVFAALGLTAQAFGADDVKVKAILGVVTSLLLVLALVNVPEVKAWFRSWREDK